MTKDEQIKELLIAIQLRHKSQTKDIARLEELLFETPKKISQAKILTVNVVQEGLIRHQKRRAKRIAKNNNNKKNL